MSHRHIFLSDSDLKFRLQKSYHKLSILLAKIGEFELADNIKEDDISPYWLLSVYLTNIDKSIIILQIKVRDFNKRPDWLLDEIKSSSFIFGESLRYVKCKQDNLRIHILDTTNESSIFFLKTSRFETLLNSEEIYKYAIIDGSMCNAQIHQFNIKDLWVSPMSGDINAAHQTKLQIDQGDFKDLLRVIESNTSETRITGMLTNKALEASFRVKQIRSDSEHPGYTKKNRDSWFGATSIYSNASVFKLRQDRHYKATTSYRLNQIFDSRKEMQRKESEEKMNILKKIYEDFNLSKDTNKPSNSSCEDNKKAQSDATEELTGEKKCSEISTTRCGESSHDSDETMISDIPSDSGDCSDEHEDRINSAEEPLEEFCDICHHYGCIEGCDNYFKINPGFQHTDCEDVSDTDTSSESSDEDICPEICSIETCKGTCGKIKDEPSDESEKPPLARQHAVKIETTNFVRIEIPDAAFDGEVIFSSADFEAGRDSSDESSVSVQSDSDDGKQRIGPNSYFIRKNLLPSKIKEENDDFCGDKNHLCFEEKESEDEPTEADKEFINDDCVNESDLAVQNLLAAEREEKIKKDLEDIIAVAQRFKRDSSAPTAKDITNGIKKLRKRKYKRIVIEDSDSDNEPMRPAERHFTDRRALKSDEDSPAPKMKRNLMSD
ncbi:Oidioi.mRNA.OKI2018_I69.chr2.g5401.t1.cds [Oikopleura dioica]|uniref:Oidioi.mRNA.OKI2018_I69.chr2.g5401.t1.cds n=1 Tax=Oikopleura dioica TaxID=34765 RepID=A0ABN7T667_OIKDI|nr:Oidioi.mRNA.OKI2018_I69.chr2.g5401.t1.cds [Oikopleura dioica]